MKEFGVRLSERLHISDKKKIYSEKYLNSTIGPNDVVYLHGGGNFGDLYRTEMDLRDYILKHFAHRRNKLILFPQTINYRNESFLRADLPFFSAVARNLTIMVRSRESFEFARKTFTDNTVMLVPDMAFMIGPIEPLRPPQVDVLVMRRVDKETNFTDIEVWSRLLNEKLNSSTSDKRTYLVKLVKACFFRKLFF